MRFFGNLHKCKQDIVSQIAARRKKRVKKMRKIRQNAGLN